LIFILRCVDEREVFGINTGIVTGIFVIIAQVFEKVNYFKVGYFPLAHFCRFSQYDRQQLDGIEQIFIKLKKRRICLQN